MIKVCSIGVLAEQGDAAAKPVLRKLAADPTHYMRSSVRTDPNTGKEILTNPKKIFYRKEIEKALAAIDAREAKKKR